MRRPELPTDQLITGYLEQFGRIGEWDATIRVKWILNSAESAQITEDDLKLQVIKAKNKTL